jgi:hypothetical protein
MFARDQEQATKSQTGEKTRLVFNLVKSQGDSQDRVVSRKTAVRTAIDAFVRKIERGEQPHRPAEESMGYFFCARSQVGERLIIDRFKQLAKLKQGLSGWRRTGF